MFWSEFTNNLNNGKNSSEFVYSSVLVVDCWSSYVYAQIVIDPDPPLLEFSTFTIPSKLHLNISFLSLGEFPKKC